MDDVGAIAAVRSGQVDAYAVLVDRYRKDLYRLCYRIAGNPVDADSLAHDSFVEAFLKLDSLQDPTRYGAWLRVLCLNLCRMWLRSKKRLVSLEEEWEASESTGPGPPNAELRTALAHLGPAHRLALALHYEEGLSYDEIARFLDVPVGTVMSRLHRARRELKRAIQTSEENLQMEPVEEFGREVEAEIRALQRLQQHDPSARERFTVLLNAAPEWLVWLVREASDAQAAGDLALLLRRLGARGIETLLACRIGTDHALRANAASVLADYVARGKPGAHALPGSRIAWSGIYLLVDRVLAITAPEEVKAEILVEALDTCTDERAALLFMNALLCFPQPAQSLLVERLCQSTAPDNRGARKDKAASGDTLWALCRTGSRFARELLPALSDTDSHRLAVALTGAEAVARTLNHKPGRLGRGWMDLSTVSDEEVIEDARHRRKWAVPLRVDRDAAVFCRLAAAVAPLARNAGRAIRIRALHTLGMLGGQEAAQAVSTGACDSDRAIRVAALRAAADLGGPEALRVLTQAVRSSDPSERKVAAEGLAGFPAEEALASLRPLSQDADTAVRDTALSCLRRFEGRAAWDVQSLASAGAVAAIERTERSRPGGSARVPRAQSRDFHMADVVRNGAEPTHFISLEAALQALPGPGPYSEREVTALLSQTCWDFSSARRYLVDERLMDRRAGVYTLSETGDTAWRVEHYIRQHYMGR